MILHCRLQKTCENKWMDRSDCNEVITLVFKETLNCVSRHLKQHLSFRLLHVADKDKSQELMFWALAPRKSKLGNCGSGTNLEQLSTMTR